MRKIITISAILLSVICGFSQSDTILILNHKAPEGMMFKWIPKSTELFRIGFDKGYNISRAEVLKTSNGGEELGAYKKLNNEPIHYWDLQKINKVMKTDSSYEMAQFFVSGADEFINKPDAENFGGALEKQQSDDWIHLLAILGMVQENEAADAMGMFFLDKDLLTAEKYVYKIEIIGLPEHDTYAIVFPASAAKDSKISNVAAELVRGATYLQWYDDNNRDFHAYNIYRSTKEKSGYEILNDLPYSDIASASDIKENRAVYIDSFPDYNKTYYYKVAGVNAFEIEGELSDPIEVKTFYQLRSKPRIISTTENGQDISLTWEMDEREEEYVKGYNIFRNNTAFGEYEKINKKVLPGNTTNYEDQSEKTNSNYYVITAYGGNGDSTNSLVKAHLLLDSIPPAIPSGVTGVCDTNGVVTLTWDSNSEQDFLGYRVFKAYDTERDAERVRNEFIKDTFVVDTINIKRPFTKIYYRLSSFDDHYNPSFPTPYLEVVIPDLNPPSNGYFKDFSVGMSGISLTWQNSTAYDLKGMKLLRKGDLDVRHREVAFFEGDDLSKTSFTDTTTKSFETYDYRLVAVDLSGLESLPTKPYVVEQLDKRKVTSIDNLEGLVSKENKLIKLKWEFKGNAIGYRIYRSENGSPMRTHKFVKGNVREYYDKWLKPDTEYVYYIVAELRGGYKSGGSKKLELKY